MATIDPARSNAGDPQREDAALDRAEQYGIDLSLLLRRRQLSPGERLRTMAETARAIVRLRAAMTR